MVFVDESKHREKTIINSDFICVERYKQIPARRHKTTDVMDGLLSELTGVGNFYVDFSRILNSDSYKRLFSKTQVFTNPSNPHVRTRALHSSDVCAAAMEFAQMYEFNVPLVQAIAMGHDIGHTPFGHMGERVLTELGGKPFSHNINSAIILQHIENGGKGLNLCFQTLSGIVNHSLSKDESQIKFLNPESSIVAHIDDICYTFWDVKDSIANNYLDEIPDLVKEIANYPNPLTEEQLTISDCYYKEGIRRCLQFMGEEMYRKGYVRFSDSPVCDMFKELKQFMRDKVYFGKNESGNKNALECIFEEISKQPYYKGVNPVILTSLLTDQEVLNFGKKLNNCKKITSEDMRELCIWEIAPYLRDKDIDYTNPDLEW